MSDIFDQIKVSQADARRKLHEDFYKSSDIPDYAASVEESRKRLIENREKYAVNLAPEEYEVINNAISNAKIPEDEAYNWATALEMSKQFGVDLADAYLNREAFSAAIWGEERAFTPKTNFKAIVDYGKLGVNTVKLGQLGTSLMMAESDGDEARINSILDEINQIEIENESLADNQDRRWWIDALKNGAQSLPYTGYVATAGLLGGLLSGGIGTGMAFAASMQLAAGMEYIDLKKEGASKEMAQYVSLLSGSLQAVVETSLGVVAGVLGGKALGAAAKKAASEKITGNLFKRLKFDGSFLKLALNMAGEYVKENFEEGAEEVIQDFTSKGAHYLASELEGYEIDPITAEKVAKDAWENFKGGVYGSLVLGVLGTAVKTHGTIKEYKDIKEAASKIPSKDGFKMASKGSKIFSEMTEEETDQMLDEIWEASKSDRAKDFETEVEDLAEITDADDAAEIYDFEKDEEGNVINASPAELDPEERTEEGALHSEMTELEEQEDGKLKGEIYFGSTAEENPEIYGRAYFTVDDENNTVTITRLSTNPGRRYLTNEIYADFASKFSGYDIKYEPTGKYGQQQKNAIIGINPRGSAYGLNYFPVTSDEHQNTRVKIAQEMRQNLRKEKVVNGVTVPVVTDEMIPSLVAEVEAIAGLAKMNITDFYKKYFNNHLFGNAEIAKQQAASEGRGPIRGGIAIDTSRQMVDQIRAVIYLAENADFSTVSHELAHLARAIISMNGGDLAAQMDKAFNIGKDGWTEQDDERLAYGWENYLHNGEAETPFLKELFEKLTEFLVRTLHALHDKIKLSDDMKAFYDKMLTGNDDMLRKAQEAVSAGLKGNEETKTAENKNVVSEATNEETAPAFNINGDQLDALFNGASMEEIEALGEKPLSPEEAEKLIKESDDKRVDEIQKQMEETKFDPTTKEALGGILEDPDIPADKKAAAVMKANGELLMEKQANIEYWASREDLTEEQRKQALEDLRNNHDTNDNGTGIPYSIASQLGLFQTFYQILGPEGAEALDKANEETIRMDNLNIADDMLKHGKDAKTIRMATGWEMGADGRWKYETADFTIKDGVLFKDGKSYLTEDEKTYMVPDGRDENGPYVEALTAVKFSDLIEDNGKILQAYPQLADIKIVKESFRDNTRGSFNGKQIHLSNEMFTEVEPGVYKLEDKNHVLNHEIQHAIQDIEGFAKGGNPDSMKARYYNSIIDALSPIYAEINADFDLKKKIGEYVKAVSEINLESDDVVEQLGNAEEIKNNDPKMSELWDKLQDAVKDLGLVYNMRATPLFDFSITDLESRRAQEAINDLAIMYDAFGAYRSLAGEVEARNVQERAELTAEERREQLLRDTEDVTREDQIIKFSDDISHAEDYEAAEPIESEAFKNWFGDWKNDPANASKVVDENGKPKVVYHGTARGDRIGKFFDPKRATSGPMAFFTDSYQIAENYSKSKADTSLSRDYQTYDDINRFTVKIGRSRVNVADAWYYLEPEQKQKIRDTAKTLILNDDGEFESIPGKTNGMGNYDYTLKEVRGNELKALYESWIISGNLFGEEVKRFPELLAKAGLEGVFYEDPDYREEKVFGVYLNLRNPFNTSNISESDLNVLRSAAEKAERRYDPDAATYADAWDKSGIAPSEWMEELENDIKEGTTYTWTRVPDWVTKILKDLGYDGIQDKGGKYHPDGHTVYIPFNTYQVKSTENRGTFDPTKKNMFFQTEELKDAGFKELTEDEEDAIFDIEAAGWDELDAKNTEYEKHNIELFEKLLKENKGLMIYTGDDDRFMTVSKNVHPDQEGEYQLTYFDRNGPWSHDIFDKPEEAINYIRTWGRLDSYHVQNEKGNILFQGPENPRDYLHKVRGGWTKAKIIKQLKELGGAANNVRAALKVIQEYESPEDLKEHMFWHGTTSAIDNLKPSITMSEREAERRGGGGYGQRYWSISITKDKKVASNFSADKNFIDIYPVLLKKGAHVITMDIQDSADLEDHIEQLWNDGVDAVWIGKDGGGERELSILNPKAIVTFDTYSSYKVFGLKLSDIKTRSDEEIAEIYNNVPKWFNDRKEIERQYNEKKIRYYIPGPDGEYDYYIDGVKKDWRDPEIQQAKAYNAEIERNKKTELSSYDYDIKKKMLFQSDAEYENAVNAGDIDKAKAMLEEKAIENGYFKPDYFGNGSWAAPSAVVEKDDFTNLEALQEYLDDFGGEVNIYGIINGVRGHDDDYYFNPDRAGFHSQAASDTAQIYRKLKYENAGPDTEVKVYRAVPNDIAGEKLMAGDWIALSRAYCEDHGANRYGEGNFHIIEDSVPIKNIWQGEEDMAEFGYDDGNADVEKNVANNRKLLEITYDENGKLIPLSQRFNENHPSILYQDDKTLAGIHNLSEENLQHVFKMGGLANPSMAVINTVSSNFNNFGEISLVAPKSLIDKTTGNNAGTYGADIYSPRYPNIKIDVTEQGRQTVKEIISGIPDDTLRQTVKERIIQAIEEGRSYNFDRAFAIPFLLENGRDDFYVIPESKLNEEEKAFYNKVKSTASDVIDMTEEQRRELSDLFFEKEIKRRKEKYPDFTEEDIKEVVNSYKDENTGILNANLLMSYWDEFKWDARKAGVIDEYETLKKAEELVTSNPYKEGFRQYKKEKLEAIDKEEKIFNGFTPSGNRRYLAHTLDNVSKFMRQQAVRGGESMSYGMGSTRARVAPKWTTLEQIAKNKDRLVSKDEFETVKAELEDTYDAITEELAEDYGYDVGEARLNEALETKNPLAYLKREYDIDFSDPDMFTSFITALKKMPTEYFETKFTRPVYMNEFYGAVIPSKTSQEVKDKLVQAGLVILEYSNEDDRMQLIHEMGVNANGAVLFQPSQEILNEASQFDSWVDFMDYCETFGMEGIPQDAASDWYLNTWEIAHNVSPTTAEREAERLEKRDTAWEREHRDPTTVDSIWYNMIQKEGNLEAFLRRAYDVTHMDKETYENLDPEEAAVFNTIQDRVAGVFQHGVWKTNVLRAHKGKAPVPAHRKQMLTLIGQRKRDYRALYGTIFADPYYKVEEAESGDIEEASRVIKANLLRNIDQWRALSPEDKAKYLQLTEDKEIREKFKKDKVKMVDPDVDHYIDLQDKELATLRKELRDQRTDFMNDISNLATLQERNILKEYADFENLKAEANERKIPLPAGSKAATETGERYKRNVSRGSARSYNELAANWATFKEEVEAKYKLQERLRAENRIEELTEKIKAEYDARKMKNAIQKAESLNAMQKEYANKREQAQATRALRDMRKKLVKAVMRRVDFSRVDYNDARDIIAIQKVFSPNLYDGINKWIGRENELAREIWSSWITDVDAKEKILKILSNKGRYDLILKLENTLNEEMFDTNWTKKAQRELEKVMPKQNWIKDLNLDEWKDERDNAIQLPIREVTKTRKVTMPDGTIREKVITFAEITPEVQEIIDRVLGKEMAHAIQYKHFEDWTTGEMEELAKKINDKIKEGRDKLTARREVERKEAERIRKQIEEAISNTGIQINEDDPEDVKKKKQAKIDKILGVTHELPGTAASKNEKQQTLIDRLLHSYHDANVRRVARLLDNYAEGVMTNLLYWQENESFNRQQRAMDRRNAKLDAAIREGNIDIKKLGKTFKYAEKFTFTYDEILMMHAAQMNQAEYYAEQLKDNPDLRPEQAEEESAYKAIKYGNMITQEERDAALKLDAKILEAERERLDKLHAAELSGNQEEIAKYAAIPSDAVDLTGNIILQGTENIKSIATARMNGILEQTESIRDEFLPLINAIRKDYADEFDRINEASIKEFNAPVWREKWYLPLVRLSVAGDENENRLKQDLLMHTVGTGKAGTEKGFTKKRIEIGPLHQMPVELGLYTTWADSVERNEHFIAYAGYVRELNRIMFSKDALGTRQAIENRYGKAMVDYLETYVKEVANPTHEDPKKGLDRVMHMLRGNTAPAYLGWKFSSILKQGIESPAPFMQFMNPAEYMHGAMELATKKWTRDAIAKKSAFMQSRVFDPMADLINENVEKSFSKKSYALKKIQQKGMEGLEWIDWACVAPGWIAAYEKEYKRLQAEEESLFEARVEKLTDQNELRYGSARLTEEQIRQQAMDDVLMDIERQAVNKADDIVRLCQPSNRKVDLAPMFKNNSEAAKAVLQFQTALNVIWQNIRYDIPYAVRNKQYSNIIGMVLGYVMAGVMSGIVTKGLLSGNGDDEPDEIAKRLAFYSTTQFIDAVPIMGGTLESVMQKVITGEGGMSMGTTIFPTAQKYLNAVQALSNEDYLKAVRNMEQGMMLTLGLPVSGIRELEAMFGIWDDEKGLELYLQALLGRRK